MASTSVLRICVCNQGWINRVDARKVDGLTCSLHPGQNRVRAPGAKQTKRCLHGCTRGPGSGWMGWRLPGRKGPA